MPELEPVTMSEVGTKLDLARAYMDMGDPEGARSILEEVVQEGSASQKQEAQRLIESSARLDVTDARRAASPPSSSTTAPSYAGWQSQAHAASIQDAVQRALASLPVTPIMAICAGRTDSGVHAIGQVIHFDTAAERTPRAWVLGANTKLPPDASPCNGPARSPPGFHARHTAIRRIYRYCLLNRSARSALQRTRTRLDSPAARRRGDARGGAGAAR